MILENIREVIVFFYFIARTMSQPKLIPIQVLLSLNAILSFDWLVSVEWQGLTIMNVC